MNGDGLIEWGMLGLAVIAVILPISVALFLNALAERLEDWLDHEAAVIGVQRDLMEAVAAYRPPRRPTAHCPSCGRFSKRVFECHGIEEVLCHEHGTDWRIERFIGDFERPIDVTASVYVPPFDELLHDADTVPLSFDPEIESDYSDADTLSIPLFAGIL